MEGGRAGEGHGLAGGVKAGAQLQVALVGGFDPHQQPLQPPVPLVLRRPPAVYRNPSLLRRLPPAPTTPSPGTPPRTGSPTVVVVVVLVVVGVVERVHHARQSVSIAVHAQDHLPHRVRICLIAGSSPLAPAPAAVVVVVDVGQWRVALRSHQLAVHHGRVGVALARTVPVAQRILGREPVAGAGTEPRIWRRRKMRMRMRMRMTGWRQRGKRGRDESVMGRVPSHRRRGRVPRDEFRRAYSHVVLHYVRNTAVVITAGGAIVVSHVGRGVGVRLRGVARRRDDVGQRFLVRAVRGSVARGDGPARRVVVSDGQHGQRVVHV